MRIFYLYGYEIWNARKAKLLLRREKWLIIAVALLTVLFFRIIKVI